MPSSFLPCLMYGRQEAWVDTKENQGAGHSLPTIPWHPAETAGGEAGQQGGLPGLTIYAVQLCSS